MKIDLTRCCVSLMTLTLAGGVTACSSTQTSNGTLNSSAPNSNGANASQVESWTIDHDGWSELGYQWQWTGFPLMKPGAGLTDAVAYEDAIITTASDTTVTCLESSTGKVRWAKQLDRPTTQLFEPERVGDTLFITSDTELHEINLKNGNTLDRDNVNAIINTKPLVMGNLAMFGTTRNQLIAFELNNDFPLWSYKFDGEFQSGPVAIDDRSIAMISDVGDLRTLATYDGSSIMTTNIAGGAVSNLLIDQGAVIVPSTDQSIYSFSLEDGYRYWRKRTSESVTVQPVVHDGIIYGSTADLGLVAIDSISGDVLWSNDELIGWVVSLANDDELMVWTGRDLAAVDIDTGEVITSVNLKGAAGVRADTFVDGSLYVITPNGAIARFSLR